MNHLTDWTDLPDAVWEACLDRARWHRAHPAWTRAAAGRALGLLFFNPSLRTRTSMDVAAAALGAHAVTLSPGQGVWGLEWRDDARMDGEAAEHVREAVGVLSRYVAALGVRTFATLADREADHADAAFRAVVAASSVPVVNLESARWHPCQALADAAAVCDTLGDPRGQKFVLSWAPHPKALPRAVPNSAVVMAARLGMEVVVARPPGFELDGDVLDFARQAAARSGGSVTESEDQHAALSGARVVYAKAWSGGAVYDDPGAEAARRAGHADWRITEAALGRTAGAAFMHCLPVRRGVVVDGDVLDGPNAVHLLQAEYRLWAQKAVLEWIWEVRGSGFGVGEVQGSGAPSVRA
ncbi:N-acetylornithine carbamoyltransferase [Rubrivirga sp. S365]|uniref:N-acetylornithine carbamoyltransferase n=1 Tax=Rubrivirga litoralis TaxID=3075598 RepID=A0ABU3BPC1_9BACT|nr:MULTISPECIES: N-acetylornithine carbamoyltransferase [unclassified Rubrivirga]MDT0631113.1 N-acetylornithine carbamoyltransferase [Rubrivirga sp. F394]MDT7855374.1 N-acetylornithine carbamoyltransferase [Rubrivirga sp. S365]